MITNHGFFDGATFRGMRQSLLKSFRSLRLCDLHGNSNKDEKSPNGMQDDNVFEIQQGVAVTLAFNNFDTEKTSVRSGELWGTRGQKTIKLNTATVLGIAQNFLHPLTPLYSFALQSQAHDGHIHGYVSAEVVFPLYSMGLKTSRDNLAMDFDVDSLMSKIDAFGQMAGTDDQICDAFDIGHKPGWSVAAAQNVAKDIQRKAWVKRVLYRPFDNRELLYHKSLVFSMAFPVLRYIQDGQNVCVSFNSPNEGSVGYSVRRFTCRP